MDDDFSADGDLESFSDDGSIADSASLAVVKNEIKMMNVVRTFVFALMITFSTISAEVIFLVVRIHEEAVFRDDFTMYAEQVVEGFYENLHTRVVAADSLTTSMTVQDLHWPYASFPEFEMRCAATRQLANASSVVFAPFISASDNETRRYWETYAYYVDQGGSLESNHTDDYRVSDTDEDTVYYLDMNRTIQGGIYYIAQGEAHDLPTTTTTRRKGGAFPLWQMSPTPPNGTDSRMYDQMSNPIRAQALDLLLASTTSSQRQQLNGVMTDFLLYDSNLTDYAYYSTPRTSLYAPVYATADQESLVATVDLEFMWETFLAGILEDDVNSLVVVAQSSCSNREFSFAINGSTAEYLGLGDLSEDPASLSAPYPVNSSYEVFLQLLLPASNDSTMNASSTTPTSKNIMNDPRQLSPCQFRIQVYATSEFKEFYMTNNPAIIRWIVLGMFLFFVGVFLVYDCAVENRSNKVIESAKQTDALVSTLFPSNVKQRLLENAEKKRKKALQELSGKRMANWENDRSIGLGNVTDDSEMRLPMIHNPKKKIKSFLDPADANLLSNIMDDTEPIADLFPNASVMFADVAGFTAWSSERDPSQVFTLLETLYRSMDKAARRFRVFKVETIGDCYVAATGLPDQREDHVEAITRFARTCLIRANELTKALEGTLGPGTSELALRFGIHSGPVTAGVLRGEKARFQLFGDTMNFAARMESTGLKNKIHLSQATADILIKRGKGHWVTQREEKVYAKGKGELVTFWLQTGQSTASCTTSSVSGGSIDSNEFEHETLGGKASSNSVVPKVPEGGSEEVLMGVIGEAKVGKALGRLVDWNTGALTNLLKKVVVSRNGKDKGIPEQSPSKVTKNGTSRSMVDEMELVIPLPEFDAEVVARVHEEDCRLPHRVKSELRLYVAAIASGYRHNKFHNFEHASHVILSATKLLKRMSYADGHTNEDGVTTEDLHHYSYGISSDPLTQFAVVFAALIHDVGHEGVPNGQLAKELPHIATLYENKSIAEQRSVDVALELLLLPKYQNLRGCICGTESEEKRFRQLLIHCVLATDIFEKDLKEKRNQRWAQAFHNDAPTEHPLSADDMNCKATVVLEHIIQASDVSHTMQHWHIYLKWNERLFQEMYAAYKAGRAEKDPSEGWYKGEMWFYDNYVIPLAKKLKECGVFGVSSDEYLTYATQNRTEWEQRGEEICKAMKERCEMAAAKKNAKKSDVRVEDGDQHHEEVTRDALFMEEESAAFQRCGTT